MRAGNGIRTRTDTLEGWSATVTPYPRVPSSEVGAPGFEPGTSRTQTVRATGLRHAPNAALCYSDTRSK